MLIKVMFMGTTSLLSKGSPAMVAEHAKSRTSLVMKTAGLLLINVLFC